MNIQSKKATVSQPQKVIFDFLSNLNNLEKLMPAEKVSNWQSDENSCSFQITGLSTIALEKKASNPHHQIHLIAKDGKPFHFDLIINILEENNQSIVFIDFNAQVNPFMKMMIEKPLTNFFNHLANAVQKQF